MLRRIIGNRDAPRRAGPGRRSSAALVVGGYAVVGCAWILLSDALLRVLVPGPAGEVLASVKGIGFVVITTVALWSILATRDHLMARSERERLAAVEATTAIFRSSPLAIVSVDRDGLITSWSPAAERALGWREDEVLGQPATVLRPDHPAWVARGFGEVMAGGTLAAVPVRYPHRDGRPRDLELFAAPLRDGAGSVRGAVVVAQDVTEANEVAAERARLATAIDQATEAIVVTDPDGRIVYVNPAFEAISGYAREELLGETPRVLKSGVQDGAVYRRMWQMLVSGQPWRGTLVNRRRDGTLVEQEVSIAPVVDASGGTTAYVGVARDLTVERALEAGLRAEVQDRIAVNAAIATIVADPTPEVTAESVVSAMRALDGIDFPSVFHLPTRGGPALRLAGQRPGAPVVPGEQVDEPRSQYLRHHAEEGPWVHVFAAESPPGPGAQAMVAAAGLTGAVYAPVTYAGRAVAVIGGLTTRPDPAGLLGSRVGALRELAAHVAPLLGPQLVARDDLDGSRSRVEAIIRNGGFHPVFQPIVRLADGSTIGYEALTRFADGVRPDQRFIEAVTIGRGIQLEVACLRAAIAAAVELPAGAWLTVNASAAMVLSGQLRPLLAGLERPVVVELTEHVAVDDYAGLRAAVEGLGGGAWLAIDDTGAGFAGLRQVVELRPHVVKLDGSIVRDIGRDPARQSLVAGLVHYARQTDSHLVAEGVETEEEATALRELGVELAQGFLFARPASIRELLGGGLAA